MRRFLIFTALASCLALLPAPARAQEAKPTPPKSKFDQLTEGKKKLTGMWTLYHTDQQMLADISASALKKEYIVITSIAKGISRGSVLGGYSWGFGDDAIWAFKKTDDKLFILQRNVRYRAKAKSPEASAVELAYSDSVLYALPILTKTSSGGVLVDVTRIFMSDDQQIGRAIGPGFRFASDRSTWGPLKTFNDNVELRVNAVYSGTSNLETVPSSKGVQVGVHYSVSVLPPAGSNGFKPRVGDDRVGYFLTAIKDFSDKNDPEHFIRYINRWNLQKQDSGIDVSLPKEPILFYLEKTIPLHLRPTVQAGILEWNKAFEKLGFASAIQVRMEEDDPNFDPENINYNTFRWITAEAGFAMGPSRVDPRTGEILDADIIFDAGFLDSWNERWETFGPEDIRRLSPNWTPLKDQLIGAEFKLGHDQPPPHQHSTNCSYCSEMQRQMGFAAATLLLQGVAAEGKLPEKLIHEGLKEVVMHEVGHTLGLRHNFKASAWKSLDDINDLDSGRKEGTVASVMDYSPANISPNADEQGLYYSQTIGPYDHWAIEYGYSQFKANESAELKKIASRSGEPALEYSTDEDTRGIDPDPLSNRFDLGKDPLVFVRRQVKTTTDLMPKIVERTVEEGEGYQRARQAFGLLMGEYWRSVAFAARYPGGLYVHRDHKGDKDALPPFKVVEASKQREAMKLIAESAFAPPCIDGQQLNYLAASRWYHWGTSSYSLFRLDYPIHEVILNMQDMILFEVLYSTTLERILDNEFKASGEDDVYTLAEHLKLIVESVFAEWKKHDAAEYSNREPMIASFRRNLQRQALTRMGYLVSHGFGAPADARTLTRMHFAQLKQQAEQLLGNEEVKLDDYSRAHLQDSAAQIDKLLNAELTVPSIN